MDTVDAGKEQERLVLMKAGDKHRWDWMERLERNFVGFGGEVGKNIVEFQRLKKQLSLDKRLETKKVQCIYVRL